MDVEGVLPAEVLAAVLALVRLRGVVLDLVLLQLRLAVEGHAAGAARGRELDALVDDEDVVAQPLLRDEPGET